VYFLRKINIHYILTTLNGLKPYKVSREYLRVLFGDLIEKARWASVVHCRNMQCQQVHAGPFPKTIYLRQRNRLNDIEFPLSCIDHCSQLFEPTARYLDCSKKKWCTYFKKFLFGEKIFLINYFIAKFFVYIIIFYLSHYIYFDTYFLLYF